MKIFSFFMLEWTIVKPIWWLCQEWIKTQDGNLVGHIFWQKRDKMLNVCISLKYERNPTIHITESVEIWTPSLNWVTPARPTGVMGVVNLSYSAYTSESQSWIHSNNTCVCFCFSFCYFSKTKLHMQQNDEKQLSSMNSSLQCRSHHVGTNLNCNINM